MKFLKVYAPVWISLVAAAAGQYVTIQVSAVNTTNVTVPDGKVAEIINLTNGGNATGYVSVNSTNILEAELVDSTQPRQMGHKSVFIAGPKTFSVASLGPGSKITCTYRILDNPPAGAQPNVPSTAVVIPTDSTGNVEIIMESSADMVTWTSALPGTYSSASLTKRFFRVRSVIQNP